MTQRFWMFTFFISWLVCGCSVATIFEGAGNMFVAVATMITAVISAHFLGGENYA